MFRLIGFLIGSAASIGAMVLLLGIPEFHLANPQLDKARFDEALLKLREKKQTVDVTARETVQQLADNVQEMLEAPADAGIPTTKMESDPATAFATEPLQVAALGDTEDRVVSTAEQAIDTAVEAERQWYSFWNPFRSEIAARGFVSQLEKVTGLDYRVVRIKTGVYQVAFAYDNDFERQTRLSQITAATGLELPGS